LATPVSFGALAGGHHFSMCPAVSRSLSHEHWGDVDSFNFEWKNLHY